MNEREHVKASWLSTSIVWRGDQILKHPTETPSQAYQLRLAHYEVKGWASDIPSLNFPISRIASRGDRERASIIIRPPRDLGNDMAHSSNPDEHAALEELRRHVVQCIPETCLKRELARQRNEDSYFTRNLSDLAEIGRFMTNLTGNGH
jgi:hypothetical protein